MVVSHRCDVCGGDMVFVREREKSEDGFLFRESEWNCADRSCWTTNIYLDIRLPLAVEKIVLTLDN